MMVLEPNITAVVVVLRKKGLMVRVVDGVKVGVGEDEDGILRVIVDVIVVEVVEGVVVDGL